MPDDETSADDSDALTPDEASVFFDALDTDDPDEYLDTLAEKADVRRGDDRTDFESRQRQNAGWLKFYVECPECETPMVSTTTEGESYRNDDGHDVSEVEMYALCPDCHAVMSQLSITRTTGSFDEIADPD